MALKLDMEKAFDCIEQNFLFAVMKALGYNMTWINLIRECVTILINGSPRGFFQAQRGLRQGTISFPSIFANDLIIFGKAKEKTIRTIKDNLEKYQSWSGQKINQHK